MKAVDNNLDLTNLTARWTVGAADVLVFDSRSAMGDAAAHAVAGQIQSVASAKGAVRMILAAAPSQSEILQTLATTPGIPWERVTVFHMDDYVGLPADAPQRFANWLDDHFFSKVELGEVHRIPSSGITEEICRDYSARLCKDDIDIVCLGIGVNGHIAFNDPPVADFNDPQAVKVVELDQVCRQQQVDDDCFNTLEDVPSHAITLTIPRLLAADALFCVVPGAYKRNAVKAALAGPVSTDCPASILRTHPNCTVFLDPEADPNAQ
ncbi:MAG: glucosamine-6-phosphate deaminase [Gammaproteobacteria bacterium]|jgi:glucosamine-6-phosphate deaminase